MEHVDSGVILKLISLASVDFYATVLVIGLGVKFNWFSSIPLYLHPLAGTKLLWVFGLLYVVEHFAEKIPGAAVIWTWAHVVVKPIATLIFLLVTAYNMESGSVLLIMIPALILCIVISLIDAKIWTFLGIIPVLPVIVTILEDIIVALCVIMTI